MREILFRGMTVNGKFVEGNLSILKNDLRYSIKIDKGCYISNSCGAPFAYQVRPDTVGQFTGLVDKHGRKIFEGDIVSYEDVAGIEDGIGNVLFDLFSGAWIVFVNDYEENLLADVAYNCEIIGNIHDQKEDV